MPRTYSEGQVRVYSRDNYNYYVGTITVLRKNYRKYFEFNESGKALAENWLVEMRKGF